MNIYLSILNHVKDQWTVKIFIINLIMLSESESSRIKYESTESKCEQLWASGICDCTVDSLCELNTNQAIPHYNYLIWDDLIYSEETKT